MPPNRFEPRPHRHTFVDFSSSESIWYHMGPLIVEHVDARGGLMFSSSSARVRNPGASPGGTAFAPLHAREDWRAGAWHHVACVWERGAPEADRMRLYLDGRRASEPWRPYAKAPLPDGTPLLDFEAPFFAQIGDRNTGRFPMRALMTDLRISRAARYHAEFEPPAAFELDRKTSAWFPFNGSLAGTGMTPDGVVYPVTATAGVLSHR